MSRRRIVLQLRGTQDLAARPAIATITGSCTVFGTLDRSCYELALSLPPLIALLAPAIWCVYKEWKRGSWTGTTSSPA